MKKFHVMADLIGLEGIAGNIDVDYEITAVDADGQRHGRKVAGFWNEAGAPVPFFYLPKVSLDHWEFRLRKVRRWVMFKNVSLEAGEVTNFKSYVVVVHLPVLDIRNNLNAMRQEDLERIQKRHSEAKKWLDRVGADFLKRIGERSVDVRIATSFKNDGELSERLKLAKERAAGEGKRIAIVIAKPDSQQADWSYSLLQGTDDDLKRWKVDESAIKEIRQSLPMFQLLWVDAAQFDELRRLIPDHEFEDQHESSIVFLESDGSWLCHFEPDPTNNPQRSIKNLRSALDSQKK